MLRYLTIPIIYLLSFFFSGPCELFQPACQYYTASKQPLFLGFFLSFELFGQFIRLKVNFSMAFDKYFQSTSKSWPSLCCHQQYFLEDLKTVDLNGCSLFLLELHSPIRWPLLTLGYLNLNQLKLNKVQKSLPQLYQPHFKCLVAICDQWLLYWTVQMQNITIIAK